MAMRTVRVVLWGALTLLSASCGVAAVENGPTSPVGGQSAAEGPAAGGAGKEATAPRTACENGKPLDREIVADREEKWGRVEGMRKAGASQKTMNASFACEMAHWFATTCPAWDPNVKKTEHEVCAIALQEDDTAMRAKLSASFTKSDIGKPAPSELWAKVNAAGGLVGSTGDRTFVRSLARLDAINPTDPKHRAILADAKQLQKDTIAFESDMEAFGSTCADVTQLEARASKVAAFTADRYRALAKKRRDAEVKKRADEIKKRINTPLAFGDTPADVRKEVAPTRAIVAELKYYDADAWKAADAEVSRWAEDLEAAIVAEEKCRATPACMGERIAVDICPEIEERNLTKADLAAEKATAAKSGVTNLTATYNLTEKLQTIEANIAAMKKQYVAVAKKPFNEASCKKK